MKGYFNMKQCITIEQWNQLNEEEQQFFLLEFNNKDFSCSKCGTEQLPTIGQLMEYIEYTEESWWLCICDYGWDNKAYENDIKICDCLWKVVKERVKTIIKNA